MRSPSKQPSRLPYDAIRAFVMAPVTIVVHGRSYPTAGCHIRERWYPSEGRSFNPTPDDESVIYGRERVE